MKIDHNRVAETITIEGIKYAEAFFYGLGISQPGDCFEVIKNEAGSLALINLADGVAIADSAARSDIEIYCKAILEPGSPRAAWYDTRCLIDHDECAEDRASLRATIDRSLRYLIGRGKIERKGGVPHLVRFP